VGCDREDTASRVVAVEGQPIPYASLPWILGPIVPKAPKLRPLRRQSHSSVHSLAQVEYSSIQQ